METCYYYNNIILWRFRNCQFDCQPGQMMVTGSEKKEEKDEEKEDGCVSCIAGIYDGIWHDAGNQCGGTGRKATGSNGRECIMVSGQFRSYNRHEELKNRLVLSVFAREIEFIDEEPDGAKTNHILLEGYMCKRPVYRKTPLGREIADLLLAVNRPYGKSDYIPCICWGRNARYASSFDVGEHVRVLGRIQSREYVKKLSETETETRVAYEVSVSKLECIEES